MKPSCEWVMMFSNRKAPLRLIKKKKWTASWFDTSVSDRHIGALWSQVTLKVQTMSSDRDCLSLFGDMGTIFRFFFLSKMLCLVWRKWPGPSLRGPLPFSRLLLTNYQTGTFHGHFRTLSVKTHWANSWEIVRLPHNLLLKAPEPWELSTYALSLKAFKAVPVQVQNEMIRDERDARCQPCQDRQTPCPCRLLVPFFDPFLDSDPWWIIPLTPIPDLHTMHAMMMSIYKPFHAPFESSGPPSIPNPPNAVECSYWGILPFPNPCHDHVLLSRPNSILILNP